MDRKQLAHDYFKQGYNCSQSVVMAFADILPIDLETAKNVSSAFGGGFARTRNLCGAVSAIGMVLGLMKQDEKDVKSDKLDMYKRVRMLSDEFEKENGTLLCGELLKNLPNITSNYVPSERTAEYYKVRPCVKFVMDAVGYIENYLNENGIETK